jgi:DNA-binding HxlR family transcriptional regulator
MRMPTSHILDDIFSTWGHVAVLRHMFGLTEPHTGRAISRAVGMTHRACLQSLKRLEIIGLVSRKQRGRSYFFVLNRGHRFVAAILPVLFEYERALVPSAAKIIRRELFHQAESVLFRYREDLRDARSLLVIDLCVIISEQTQQDVAQRHLANLGERLRHAFGVRLEAVILSEHEFRRRSRRQLPPTGEFLAGSTVVFGKTLRELLL